MQVFSLEMCNPFIKAHSFTMTSDVLRARLWKHSLSRMQSILTCSFEFRNVCFPFIEAHFIEISQDI